MHLHQPLSHPLVFCTLQLAPFLAAKALGSETWKWMLYGDDGEGWERRLCVMDPIVLRVMPSYQ